ncbi:ubiquitin-like domain-containing CTD phosphatase 1 isoform X1 [Cajanus cajan]|nr:ubiquitin-like domain-containing CTD phosphatase 1 isoform X1 [Cajanus cajan]
MEPLREQRKKVVADIPNEGIETAMNTESAELDEANSDKQVSCSEEMRKLSVFTIDEEDREKALRISSVGRPIVCLKKKLIVLDVNGLLVDIVSSPPKYRKPDATIRRRAIFKRPFYLEFLNFCLEKFEVGVWSSRTKKNIDSIIDYLMGNMKQRLLFCWDLSHCTETSFKTLENKYKPVVFKDLRKIWDKHDSNLPWEKGYYNESNTLLLDDSPYKALLNPPCNSVFPHTFKFQSQSDKSLGAGGDLRQYLDGLANAENMVKYVEQHPFGQEGINEKSQCWNFYLKVLDSLSTC